MRLKLKEEDSKVIFNFFDREKNNKMKYREFIAGVRGYMSEYRLAIVERAYSNLIGSSQTGLTLDSLRANYTLAHFGEGSTSQAEYIAAHLIDLLSWHIGADKVR
jgi:hypothetical protein